MVEGEAAKGLDEGSGMMNMAPPQETTSIRTGASHVCKVHRVVFTRNFHQQHRQPAAPIGEAEASESGPGSTSHALGELGTVKGLPARRGGEPLLLVANATAGDFCPHSTLEGSDGLPNINFGFPIAEGPGAWMKVRRR